MTGKMIARIVFGALHLLLAIVVVAWIALGATLPSGLQHSIARWASFAGFLIAAISYFVHAAVDGDRKNYSPWTWVRWYLVVPAFTLSVALPAANDTWAWVAVVAVAAISFWLQYAQSVNEEMNSEVDELSEGSNESASLMSNDETGGFEHTAVIDPHWTSFGQATIAFVLLTIVVILFAINTATSLLSASMIYFYVFQFIYVVFHFIAFGYTYCCAPWTWTSGSARAIFFGVILALLGLVTLVANFIHPHFAFVPGP